MNMNAADAPLFSLELCARETSADHCPYLLGVLLREIDMTSFRTRTPISRAASVTGAIVAAAWTTAALAAQGPGSGMGTASPLTQTVMAVLVYGASAIIIGAGLIGVVRRR